jgi:integrase
MRENRQSPPIADSIRADDGPSADYGMRDLSADSTIADIVRYWLRSRQPEVKPNTWKSYRQQASLYVVGPLPVGTKVDRFKYAIAETKSCELVEMLGPVQIRELSTARIRTWHRSLCIHVSPFTARVAKKHLRSALALAAEDFNLHVPMMPSHRGRGVPSARKTILNPAQIGLLLQSAINDHSKGIYYAFPFLTGTRPSEQLGLLWNDVDFLCENIHVCRTQQSDGSIAELTKTVAGVRDIPMSGILKRMLLEWRERCPTRDGFPHRVFPALGWLSCPTHKKRGCALSYNNFLVHYWRPAFQRIGLPYVTPHSARHAFISTLQATGVEVGLAAKLAGHADPSITLSHYTQAVRGGTNAIKALEEHYSISLAQQHSTT